MQHLSHRYSLSVLMLLTGFFLSTAHAETEFKFGGFIKADMMASDYQDGAASGAIRDFHIPGAIPVGDEDGSYQIDFHAKESRFNLGTKTDLENGKQVNAFLEFDFMLSDAGDERVSNSYQPRMRHAYFTYDKILAGQTWSTFMVIALPDDLDFIGAAEGAVFVRQTQLRYTSGGLQLSLENPYTTITPYSGGDRISADSSAIPDLVARYNFGGDSAKLSVAGIYRQLKYDLPTRAIDTTTNAFGVTFGGTIKLGSQDDLRFVLTSGSGLGRYLGLNFINDAVLDVNYELDAISSTNGYVAYLHHWNAQWRSSFDVSAFIADNDVALTGTGVNKSASSASVNLLYSPDPQLTFGVELMHGNRELESGVDGSFNRVQFSAKYAFSFASAAGK